MEKGYCTGMISMENLSNVALLDEHNYPFVVFRDYLENIKNTKDYDLHHQYCNNLDFLLRINKCVLSIRDEKTQYVVCSFLSKFINQNFNSNYSYNWQELKSILFYCNYMHKLTSYRSFAAKVRDPFFTYRFCSYVINDSVIPESKILFQKLHDKAISVKERKYDKLVYRYTN